MAFLLLKFILTILALFFNVLGAPLQAPPIQKSSLTTWEDGSGLTLHNYGYQGDGLYRAAFDNAGIATVQFTPFEDLEHASKNVTFNSTERIEARHHDRWPTHAACANNEFLPSEKPAYKDAAKVMMSEFGAGFHIQAGWAHWVNYSH